MSSVQAPLLKKSVPTQATFPETELEKATIRFAGDSGDGMQLTGTRFSLLEKLSSKLDTPANVPAGALISAG